MKRFFSVVSTTTSSSSSAADGDGDGSSPPGSKKRPGPRAGDTTASVSSSAASTPLKFIAWNCNSLLQRLQSRADWADGFKVLVEREQPDVIALQEVKLPAAKGADVNRRARMHQGDNKATHAEHSLVYSTVMKMGYRVVLALADTKRAGTLVMVRKPLDQTAVRGVRFHFPGQEPRYEEEGRVILLDFDEFSVLGTYVPNHGYTPDSFARRRRWDEKVLAFVRAHPKPLVWLGDLNVSHLDFDVSHPNFFANQRGPSGTPAPPFDHRGQPGYAPIERQRFGQILGEGRLVDAYRRLHPERSDNDWTWRGCGPEHARYWAKGMRIDYTLVSQALLEPPHNLRIKRAEILGHGVHRTGFFGSDHCPILLELERVRPAPGAAPAAAAAAAAAAAVALAAGTTEAKAAVAVGGDGGATADGEEKEKGKGKEAPAAVVVDLSADD